MLKKILIFGIISAIIGGGIGFYQYNKPHESLGEAKITVSAVDLTKEFVKSETAADSTYGKDKTILVTGKITEIKNDTSGITLTLDTSDPENTVSCVLDKFSKQPRTDYKIGEEVSMKGKCLGINMHDITIDRCFPK
jgi:hypothetical protein